MKTSSAFLMVIASREAKTIFLKDGYGEAYRALPGRGKFNSFLTHPFKEAPKGTVSPSGAYGITRDTWERHLPFLDISGMSELFSPSMQDRIAITIMEQNGNALGLLRRGRIEEAANRLATVRPIQWSSLPGGNESNGFTVPEMMDSYNKFLGTLK